jgi:flagellar hook protein FlgE
MLQAVSAALSGLRAQQTRLSVSANNVANQNTLGFQKARALLEEDAGGGVRARVERVGDRIELSGDAQEAPSNVDLVEEVGELVEAPQSFRANAAVLRAADDAQKSLLDVLA